MTNLERHEARMKIYYRDRAMCQACGKPVTIHEFQVAHRIADTKANRKKYGGMVIDHPLNKAATHPGRCNDAMNCGFNPVACALLVGKMHKDMEAK